MVPLVGIIGPNADACNASLYDFGVRLGRALGTAGYTIVCGGMGGWMEAVCRGVKSAGDTPLGRTIGLLPTDSAADANPYIDIVIPTGLGTARNVLIANAAEVLVAAGGGAGTLSEIAFAWQRRKPVLCVTGFGGWAERLAGQAIDTRRGGALIPVESIDEILFHLRRLVK